MARLDVQQAENLVKVVITEQDGTRVIMQVAPDAAIAAACKLVEAADAARLWTPTTTTA